MTLTSPGPTGPDPVSGAAADGLGLEGRTALVTGGAAGIGAAVAARLAAAGVHGVVLDLHAAQDLPPGWSSAAVDVRDAGATERAVETAGRELGRLDVVVAAAGIVPPWTSLADLRLAEWDDVLAVNVRGLVATLRAAVPSMGPGGSVVAVGSLNSWRGDPNLMSYVASKHAVLGVVRSAALELGPAGIRVNAVGPGPVATDALLGRLERRHAAGGPSPEQALAAAGSRTALGRTVTVDEVAAAVLLLASPLSSGITGHLLPVDAGIT